MILTRLHHDSLDANVITSLACLLSEQQAATDAIPSNRTPVTGRTHDGDGGWRIVLLNPFGRHIHEP